MKKRVTSFGGVFVKSANPEQLRKWYATHLDFKVDDYGTNFEWRKSMDPASKGYTIWSTFEQNTDYFKPSEKEFMLNFRVKDLENLVPKLIDEGVIVLDQIETFEYGKFIHIMDPDGTKIELWEPNDVEFENIIGPAVMKS